MTIGIYNRVLLLQYQIYELSHLLKVRWNCEAVVEKFEHDEFYENHLWIWFHWKLKLYVFIRVSLFHIKFHPQALFCIVQEKVYCRSKVLVLQSIFQVVFKAKSTSLEFCMICMSSWLIVLSSSALVFLPQVFQDSSNDLLRNILVS